MKTLFVLLGPTGVGKTELSISLARLLHSPIINADSRQFYRGLSIGTAAPTQEQQEAVPHYFVGTLNLQTSYSAAQYEADALDLMQQLFKNHDSLLLSGGSMLYIDAVCKGLDDIPIVDEATRQLFQHRLQQEGLVPLVRDLELSDPTWYRQADLQNPRRVIHALEVCHFTGRPYSSFLNKEKADRPFRTIKIGLQLPREMLYERINSRVDDMISHGFIDEARRVFPLRHLNALNTIGYKELFNYLDGTWTLEQAVFKIKRNTRLYARKQMMWFNRDDAVVWFRPDKKEGVLHFASDICQS